MTLAGHSHNIHVRDCYLAVPTTGAGCGGEDMRNGTQSRVAVLAILLALTVSLSTAPKSQASASPSDQEEDGGSVEGERLLTPEQARAADISAAAAMEGISKDEAAKRMAIQDDAISAATRAAADFPDTYAGSWMVEGPPYHGVVAFKGPAPRRDESWPSTISMQGGAGRSLRELDHRVDEVHSAMAAEFDRTVMTYRDEQTQRISTTAELARGTGRSAAQERVPDTARRQDVDVAFTYTPLVVLQHTYGGALTTSDGSGGDCTTGFVANKAGTDGVLTAGHCGNDRTYHQPGTSTSYDMPFVSPQHRGEWGDFQFHSTTGHVDYAEFYSDWSIRRDVLGYLTPAQIPSGVYLGVFGRTGGRNTSTLWKTNVYLTDSDGYNLGRLIATREAVTAFGDSGGPWFRNNDALGIHMGIVNNLDGAARSLFSSISYSDNAVGAYLTTK